MARPSGKRIKQAHFILRREHIRGYGDHPDVTPRSCPNQLIHEIETDELRVGLDIALRQDALVKFVVFNKRFAALRWS
jgi:hypothetical protein